MYFILSMVVLFLRDYGRRINRVGCKLRESDEESKNGRISRISAAAINAQIYRASAIGLCVSVDGVGVSVSRRWRERAVPLLTGS